MACRSIRPGALFYTVFICHPKFQCSWNGSHLLLRSTQLRYEGFEQLAGALVVGCSLFWMELHRKQVALTGFLHRLNHPIWGVRRHDQARRDLSQRLVMKGVRQHLLSAHDSTQAAVRLDEDRM